MWIIVRIIIAVVFLAILQFYFIKKSTTTIKQLFSGVKKKTLKIFVAVFLILINLYPATLIAGLIYSVITKQSPSFPDSGWLDYLLIYPFWLVFILVFQMVVYFLLFDFIKIFIYAFLKKQKEKYKRVESLFVLVLLVFFIIYIPARIVYDYNTVDVNHITLTKSNLPNILNNFKIAFISDIQADRYTDDKRLKSFIDKVNSTNPDLVLIAGDVITSTPDYIDKAAEYIGMLKSKYGVYSCIGDHDNWAYRQDTQRSLAEVEAALRKYNVKMLDDTTISIAINSSTIGITFITNTYVESIPTEQLKKLSGSNESDFKIFLTHQPKKNLIAAAEQNNYDLFLAGHTHGGQITLLFPFIQLTPTLIETTFIRGTRYYGKMLAIVTRGLGMSLAPIRYNSTPEIVVITLKSKVFHKE
jgi:predicted MPP superfamily phosphohydrolase